MSGPERLTDVEMRLLAEKAQKPPQIWAARYSRDVPVLLARLATAENVVEEARLSEHWFRVLLRVIEKFDAPLNGAISLQASGGEHRLRALADALAAYDKHNQQATEGDTNEWRS